MLKVVLQAIAEKIEDIEDLRDLRRAEKVFENAFDVSFV